MPDRRAQLEEKIRAFQEQAAKAGQLKDKISELRGQARSGDGSVVATVAPSGAVLGLQLSPNAMKYSHTQLQQEILATIRAATQQAAQALQETVVPVLGDQAERFKDAFNAHSNVMMPEAPHSARSPWRHSNTWHRHRSRWHRRLCRGPHRGTVRVPRPSQTMTTSAATRS